MESQGCNPSAAPETAKTLRFVILRHVRQEDTHWDLMLEQPAAEKLATWQIHLPPEKWGLRLPAVRLPDHRRNYLQYEGEISGGRGHVTRVDEGTVEVLERLEQDTCWRIKLNGRHIAGTFEVGPFD